MGVIRASDVINLLRIKHAEDVFLTEVTVGGVFKMNAKRQRLDAIAMKPSWTDKGAVIGYEVKVDRGDFLNDGKWRDYLDSCEQFYFVAPKGLIQSNELPPEAGLMEVSTNVKRITCRKRAIVRMGAIGDDTWRRMVMLLRYGKVSDPQWKPFSFEEWRAYYAHRDERSKIGKEIGRRIADKMRSEKSAVAERERLIERSRSLVDKLRENGLIDQYGGMTEKAEKLLNERTVNMNSFHFRRVRRTLAETLEMMDELEAKQEAA